MVASEPRLAAQPAGVITPFLVTRLCVHHRMLHKRSGAQNSYVAPRLNIGPIAPCVCSDGFQGACGFGTLPAVIGLH